MDEDADLAPAPGGEPEPVSETPSKIERATQIVNAWVVSSLFNSPLSRSTEAWNHLSSQLPKLASDIAKEL